MRVCVCVVVLKSARRVSAEHAVGGHGPESLHRHTGLPSNDRQRLLADGVAGEHEGDRHDNEGGREGPGQYQEK